MNPSDILKYGHLTVLSTVERFPRTELYTSGACGYWSVKDLVGHLGSFELVLVEILTSLVTPGPTPLADQLMSDGRAFNAEQVDRLRKDLSFEHVLQEYIAAYDQVESLVPQIPPETWRSTGVLPFYGEEYDLEDFIVYTYYGHKREHSGQIAVFHDRFKP